MANDLGKGGVKRVAPELATAAKLAVAAQTILVLFGAGVLDGGWLLILTLFAVAIYWLWFGFVVFLRGNLPTQIDMLVAKWGFIPLWITLLCAALAVAKMRGV
jgi:hypothetical protein